MYKLLLDQNAQVREDLVLLLVDGGLNKYIPNDPDNADWQAYQAWLALGNTPEPAE